MFFRMYSKIHSNHWMSRSRLENKIYFKILLSNFIILYFISVSLYTRKINSTNYKLTLLGIGHQLTKLTILIKSALTIITGKTSDITIIWTTQWINEIRNHDSQASSRKDQQTRLLCQSIIQGRASAPNPKIDVKSLSSQPEKRYWKLKLQDYKNSILRA